MRMNFLPLVVIAGLTFGGAAFADTTAATTAPAATTTMAKPAVATPADVSGTITKISTGSHYIVLSNGAKYHFAKSYSLSSLKVGDKVTVTYTMSGKKHEASAVKAAV